MINLKEILPEIKIEKNNSIADFGCGISFNLFEIDRQNRDKNLKLFFVDINKNVLERIESEIQENLKISNTNNSFKTIWTDFDGKKIYFFEEKLDIIILENIYTYLNHKKSFILEIKKILKHGGKVVFIDKHTSFPKSIFLQQILSSQKNVERLFEEAGFLVYPINKIGKYSYAFIAENVTKIKIENQ